MARRASESRAALIAATDAPLLAPIPVLIRNAFCVGRDYLDHIKEGAATLKTDPKLPEAPRFFTKATHTVVGPAMTYR